MRLGLFTYSQAISHCSGNVAPRVLGAYNEWQGKKRHLMYFLDEFHMELRKALPMDADDFAALVLISSPSLFPAIYGDGVGGRGWKISAHLDFIRDLGIR
jgi:hypothetical protein